MTATTEASWLSEIQSQPAVLRDTLAEFEKSDAFKSAAHQLRHHKFKFIFTVSKADHPALPVLTASLSSMQGMGSSYFNSLPSVQFLLRNGVHAEARETSEWLALYSAAETPSNAGWAKRAGEAKVDLQEKVIVVAVSQSGESGELCELLKLWQSEAAAAGEKGPLPLLWAITNTPQSTLAKAATHVFLTKAGVELTVSHRRYLEQLLLTVVHIQVACKTYVGTVLVQHLVSRLIASVVGNLSEAVVTDALKAQVADAAKLVRHAIVVLFSPRANCRWRSS